MEITAAQFDLIGPFLPRQRGNVVHQNVEIINAILWLAENDCKWSALPKRFGSWHTVYTRVNRWSKAGVLDRLFEQMQRLGIIRLRLEVAAVETAGSAGSAAEDSPRYMPRSSRLELISEPPKFAWVPRIRICHRRVVAIRRTAKLQRKTPHAAAPGALSDNGHDDGEWWQPDA